MVLLKFKNQSDYEFDYENVGKIFFFDWKQIENPFDILPMEMKMMIFINLDPEDITQFGKCSKSCQKLFKLLRPKIKSVYYRGNIEMSHSQECYLQIQFHKYPTKISSILLTKFTITPQSTYQDTKLLLHRTNPKWLHLIAFEIFKNIIEFNKSSIDEITIEANSIESIYMRVIDIYSENLKILQIDGNFTDHPQLNQFLSIEFVSMKNFKISSQHLPMIKSKDLVLHKTVMDQTLYNEVLTKWRDGLMENLRKVTMFGDDDWFHDLFVDNTILRVVMNEYGELVQNSDDEIRCEVVGSPSVDISIQGGITIDMQCLVVRIFFSKNGGTNLGLGLNLNLGLNSNPEAGAQAEDEIACYICLKNLRLSTENIEHFLKFWKNGEVGENIQKVFMQTIEEINTEEILRDLETIGKHENDDGKI
ncbi:unnamed protein product [Caenorhabditis angaria]|uniref:F-box domain-containing protein n=1 Tax=Caenorhabditis angaria TaxID=860376 RepID=A0A9P1MUC2_9PELO|nr:unnamed protein product [Caenorhabditis angaria]